MIERELQNKEFGKSFQNGRETPSPACPGLAKRLAHCIDCIHTVQQKELWEITVHEKPDKINPLNAALHSAKPEPPGSCLSCKLCAKFLVTHQLLHIRWLL